MADPTNACCGGAPCGEPTRRSFLQQAAVLGAGFLAPGARIRRSDAPPPPQGDHFVPADKQLTKAWTQAMFAKGPPQPWRGDQLRTVAMPCGGIAAGQLYVTADGRWSRWWIANDACHTSYGGDTRVTTPSGDIGVCYGTTLPEIDIGNGTALAVKQTDGSFAFVELATDSFLGEYPVATIESAPKGKGPALRLRTESFAPFVPLATADSALPATLLRISLTNDGKDPVTAVLARWCENPVLRSQRGTVQAELRNVALVHDGRAAVAMDAVALPAADALAGEPIVFADFEDGYGKWQRKAIVGDPFGEEPAAGTLERQQPVDGFHGGHLVNTYRGGDDATGMLWSPEFKIEKPYIAFRIGGGQDAEDLALSLGTFEPGAVRVSLYLQRTATGLRRERLREAFWDVRDLIGKRAQLVVRDMRQGAWGHVNVDYIRFCDQPPPVEPLLQTHPQAGQVVLASLDEGGRAFCGRGLDAWLHAGAPAGAPTSARGSLDVPPFAAVAHELTLQPRETRTVTFALAWHFPHRRQRDDEGLGPGEQCGTEGPRVGNRYAAWFPSALAVAQYLREHHERLVRDTFSCRDALYRDTTLPGWFVQRIGMPLSTLATGVLQWWEDGRVWAWEGVGCCAGTCGHVWNYAQGMARLFPELERSVREHQDFAAGAGLQQSGAIGFRGTPKSFWAGDAQGGYVLKAYREHLMSRDDAFLRRVWPAVKQALEFLIAQDALGHDAPDGLLEDRQHNTYDIDFYGGNTMVGSLYLGALAAGARMAAQIGDAEFAARCAALQRSGSDATMQRLWNGEYFVQQVDAKAHPKWQYGDGCLSDQLLGQWFADQLDLGYLYPRDAVRAALQSVYKYNWAPDTGPQNKAHAPERHFAHDGEAGLFTCTWPRSAHLGKESVRYRDEIWSGIEYQVAAHLLREGFVTEGLAIVRGIHERYAGEKHNPFNEVECGDHYARALASWSCLLAISGFVHDGPAGRLGFAPRIDQDDFRCFFSAAEGWGTLLQTRKDGAQQNAVRVRGGRLLLRELRCQLAPGKRCARATVDVAGGSAPPTVAQDDNDTTVTARFEPPLALPAGATVTVHWE